MTHFRIYKVISLEQYNRMYQPCPVQQPVAVQQLPPIQQPCSQALATEPPRPISPQLFGGSLEKPESTALLLALPEGQRSRAKRLINFILDVKKLTWNTNGNISYDEKTIPKSNIIDLLSAATSHNKLRKLSLPGIGLFIKFLKDVNVPKYFLNTEFVKLLDMQDKFEFEQCKPWITYEMFTE